MNRSRIQHLVGVSGGKDSTAVYLRAIDVARSVLYLRTLRVLVSGVASGV